MDTGGFEIRIRDRQSLIHLGSLDSFDITEGGKSAKGTEVQPAEELSKEETKQRIVALCLVFTVVIFFWMAFHQNGLSLTYFANEFTAQEASGVQSMPFNVWNLVAIIVMVYGLFGFFQNKTSKGKTYAAVAVLLAAAFLGWQYSHLTGTVAVSAPIFQQFNPFYVVALTPVSMAIFGSMAKKGKEPSAPRKIAYGMLIAAAAYCLMAFASVDLPMPLTEMVDGEKVAMHVADVTPNLLIGTYLILTFAELLLSPMGISFVSKVAPPKYKGMMMGGWFVATAIGNQLVMVGGLLWGAVPMWAVWSVFIGVCLVAAIFMFAIMKRLEKVC